MSATLVVTRSQGLVTIQDGGRPGFMHLAIPPGGPLAPSRFDAATRAVGNSARDAAFEIVGELAIRVEGGAATVSVDGEPPVPLEDGATFAVASTAERRVRVLAVAGGLDVPSVYGGKGTLLVAGLGGLEGRLLRRGDRLPVAARGGPAAASPAKRRRRARVSPREAGVVRVGPGPDATDEALRALFRGRYVLDARSDRVGARLVGPTVPMAATTQRRASSPMVAGAIEVPGNGLPIVLGPDHPTTGGYPLIGFVVDDELERVVAAPIGARIRFAPA